MPFRIRLFSLLCVIISLLAILCGAYFVSLVHNTNLKNDIRHYVITHQRLHSEIDQLQHALESYNYDMSNLDWFNTVKRYNSILEYNNELLIRKQNVQTLLHEQGLLTPYQEPFDQYNEAISAHSKQLLKYYEINSIDTVNISQNINELQQQINAYIMFLNRINDAMYDNIPPVLLNENITVKGLIELILSPALLIIIICCAVAVLTIFGLTLKKIVERVYFSHPNPVVCLNGKGKVLCFNKSMHKLNGLFDNHGKMTPVLDQFHQQQWKKLSRYINEPTSLLAFQTWFSKDNKDSPSNLKPYIVGHFMYTDEYNNIHHFDVEYIIVRMWFYFRVFARFEIIKDVRQSKSAQRTHSKMQHLSQIKRLIDHEVERSKRQSQNLAHVMLSFSNQKTEKGLSKKAHTQHFLELVNQRKRQTDILVQINEHVYALFCIDCNAEQAQSIPRYLHANNDHSYSIDCGIVELRPFDSTKQILRRGLTALKQAYKHEGKNRIQISDD